MAKGFGRVTARTCPDGRTQTKKIGKRERVPRTKVRCSPAETQKGERETKEKEKNRLQQGQRTDAQDHRGRRTRGKQAAADARTTHP